MRETWHKNMKQEQINFLAENGWVSIDNYFDKDLVDRLIDRVKHLRNSEAFQKAQIGKDSSKLRNSNIRKDSIYWIENWSGGELERKLGKRVAKLGVQLRQELRISIKSFEGHFSHYRSGDFYLKHLDQHIGSKHRQISFVCYLNQGNAGGELVIYNQNDPNLVEKVIQPQKGCVVIFLSSLIYHEVLPSSFDRMSFTGWFRDDADLFDDILEIEM